MNVEKVHKALEKLQPAHQEVIVMRFILGFSLKEAAALLGKTVGAIKITQHRGLNELRSILGAEGIEE
jgi:RNA polymerase sigma-70 factor (ECF subfamily)